MAHYDSEAESSDAPELSSSKKRAHRSNRSETTDEIGDDPKPREEPPPAFLPQTIVIPCHHIRLGDFVMLEGRPCQVIKIETSALTGQYRYTGLDLFTKQLHEDVSTIHHPSSSVVYQTMMGPIFKQYRVLDMSDGHVVAMTEWGDIIVDLDVFDQSGLWARLSSAFETGRGSVRVLVLDHGGHEIAVDMKVIYLSGLNAYGDRADGRPRLSELAYRGDVEGVLTALEEGAEINGLDEDGKTAIFHAIEQRHGRVIGLLVERDNDFEIEDRYGMTALDYAVRVAKDDPMLHWIPERLMKSRASPTNNIDLRTLYLLQASAKGDLLQVQSILHNLDEATINATDRLGYTALHEAAFSGKYDIANTLISHGACVEAEVALGGDTVLHAVVERREHRSFLGEGRNTPLPLEMEHARVFELLLRDRTVQFVERRRSSDKKTVQELVLEKLKAEGLSATEQSCLHQILMILKGHGKLKGDQSQITRLEQRKTISSFDVIDESYSQCRFCSLRVQEHPFGSNENAQEKVISTFLLEPSSVPKGKDWIWVHLRKNNKAWVKEVMNAIRDQKFDASELYSRGSSAFLEDAYDEMRCGPHHPGMRRPSFAPFHPSYHTIFSLVIPYFDSESAACLDTTTGGCSKVCKRLRAVEGGMKSKYNDKHDSTKNWHDPCTLDQSYYVSLEDSDSSSRNKDQVVSKHMIESQKDSILMVKQMWIWKTDCDTLITAFPDRCRDHGKVAADDSLSSYLDHSMRQRPPLSIDLMTLQMMQCAIEFFDAPTNSGLKENVLDIFQRGIARQNDIEAKSYEDFQELHKDRSGTKGDEARIDNLCDITGEVDALLEIKDIENELKMIEKVFLHQKRVIDQYQRKEGLSSPEQDILKRLQTGLVSRRSRVQELLKDAQSVESSLNNLLDMKQKQGNLHMVRDTRRRALDSEWQTKLLFVFTIVTVIFTPISFVCGFLAVPSQDFPDNGSDNVAWTWRQVFIAAVVTESVTVVPLAAYWWFQASKNGRRVRTMGTTEQRSTNTQYPTKSGTSGRVARIGLCAQKTDSPGPQAMRGNGDIV